MNLVAPLSVSPYHCVCGNAIALMGQEPQACLRCGRPVSHLSRDRGDSILICDNWADPDEDNTDPLLNSQIKHFRILSRLGQGGMGAVYRAVDESLERYVALKILRTSPRATGDASHTDRLLQEARAQARICHPNVVQVYYIDSQGDLPFLAMELVRGESLCDRLNRGDVTFAETVEVARQTCLALACAAKYGIVHGDIKPANLLMTLEGAVKLSDFGLARPLERRREGSKHVAGTPNYLSPEACRGERTDHRSDMYALGVMLFEMTFGRLPHTVPDKSLRGRLHAHLHLPPEFPETWPADLPIAWKHLLERLLSKTPEERFDSYEDILQVVSALTPTHQPRAGRIVRPLAWIVDLALMFVLVQPVLHYLHVDGETFHAALFNLAGAGLAGSLLLGATLTQAIAGTSLGKKLCQLRIVDHHGLPVADHKLFLRHLAQYLPVWTLLLSASLKNLGFDDLALAIAFTGGGLTLANMASALFREDSHSLHDLMGRTRVVLDTSTPTTSLTETILPTRLNLPDPALSTVEEPLEQEQVACYATA